MTVKTLLSEYADYNLWANTQMANWLKSKASELMEAPVSSSFPNLKITVLHIWGAEKVWLERLNEQTPETFITDTFQGTALEALDGWVKFSGTFQQYVHSLSDEQLMASCDFKLLNGTADNRPRVEMIQHCMNHSTYHRGQMVTMARSLGLTDPPQTDYIKYIRIR